MYQPKMAKNVVKYVHKNHTNMDKFGFKLIGIKQMIVIFVYLFIIA